MSRPLGPSHCDLPNQPSRAAVAPITVAPITVAPITVAIAVATFQQRQAGVAARGFNGEDSHRLTSWKNSDNLHQAAGFSAGGSTCGTA